MIADYVIQGMSTEEDEKKKSEMAAALIKRLDAVWPGLEASLELVDVWTRIHLIVVDLLLWVLVTW